MLDLFIDFMPLFMFLALAILLFSGYPVAAVLGGIALGFGYLGVYLDVFVPIEFFNIVGRIWSGIADNLVLVAIPMFIFMGTMLEKSGVARDLLYCLQVLLRRVPGGLALSVTVMGTIMAATTGIIGASVVMMTLMALPGDDASTIQHTAGDRNNRRVGDTRNIDSTEHHARDHGGPARSFGRQPVCRGGFSGPVARFDLRDLHFVRDIDQALPCASFAERYRTAEYQGIRSHDSARFGTAGIADFSGSWLDRRRLGDTDRSIRSGCGRCCAAGSHQSPAQFQDDARGR